MEEKTLTIKDDLIADILELLRKASRKADRLMDDYKPVLHGERLMTDGELATVLRVSPRALRDYRNNGILPYIRMKGNILPQMVNRLLDGLCLHLHQVDVLRVSGLWPQIQLAQCRAATERQMLRTKCIAINRH